MAKQIRGALPENEEGCRKALEWIFAFPGRKITLSGLSAQAGISKATASRAVSRLEKEGLIKKEAVGRAWQIYGNQKNPLFIRKKIAYNLGLICNSGIIEAIGKEFSGFKAAILFGSYRKGDDVETSDIDIAVEVAGNDEPKIVELGYLPSLGHRKKVLVSLYVFSREKVGLNMFANIANGIVLEGFLEVRP